MPNHRKPNEIHKLQGTYRKDRHGGNTPELEPISSCPDPPSHFNRWAKKEWKRVVPQLWELDLITEPDLGLLEMGIEQYGIYKECIDSIYHEVYEDEYGKTRRRKRKLYDYLHNKSSQQTPELSLMKSAFDKYKEIMYKFGATPVERTKVEIDKSDETDPMEKLLSNQKQKVNPNNERDQNSA